MASAFAPVPPERLGWLRVLLGGYATFSLWGRIGELSKVAHSPPEMFKPLGVTTLLEGPLNPALHDNLVVLAVVLGVFFTLGAMYRVTGPAFALLVLFLLTYRTSWVQIYHSDNLMTLQILALGLAPQAGEVRSVDALWLRPGSALRPDRKPWEWMWPVALLCTVTTTAYVIAGLAKAQAGGIGWSIGDNLRNQVAYDTLNKELLGHFGRSMARELYAHPGWLVPASIVSFWAELGAWTALVDRRLGMVWSFVAFGMHHGILMVMGIAFGYPLSGVPFLPFFPVERPLDWLVDKARRRG